MGFFSTPLDVKGKHCYITGGSAGLGRSLASQLVKRGAHVTIVARDPKKGEKAVEDLKSEAPSTSQIIQFISADLVNPESSQEALDQACKAHNRKAPLHVYLCAGFSEPKFFIDSTPEHLKAGLDGTYWCSAYTAHAAVKMMVSQKIKGKIVFVSSFLGYTSFVGYTPYSPGKYAIRGLADALRSEMLLFGIDVHLFMPAGIKTEGYKNEQIAKPRITKKIEEGDVVLDADEVCKSLINGIEKGYYQIANVLITDLIRLQSRGAAPSNNVFLDTIYWLIGGIGVPIWRMITDYQVRADAPAVMKELEDKGFFKSPDDQ